MNRSWWRTMMVGATLAFLAIPAVAQGPLAEERMSLTQIWESVPPLAFGKDEECHTLVDHPEYTLVPEPTRDAEVLRRLWPEEFDRLRHYQGRVAALWTRRAEDCPAPPPPPELELERTTESTSQVSEDWSPKTPADLLGL